LINKLKSKNAFEKIKINFKKKFNEGDYEKELK
jgi:hypothetical protein